MHNTSLRNIRFCASTTSTSAPSGSTSWQRSTATSWVWSAASGPPFPFGGAWLYCGDQPVVHLVEIETGRAGRPTGDEAPARPAAPEPRLSHFAFTGTGMAAFIARLEQAGVPHAVARLPGSQVFQVNLRDPDGNALHVDFAG